MPAPLFACSHAYVAACPSAGISHTQSAETPAIETIQGPGCYPCRNSTSAFVRGAKVAERRVWGGISHQAEW
jgi:hypothetical protein